MKKHDDLSYRGYPHIENGRDQDCHVCRREVENEKEDALIEEAIRKLYPGLPEGLRPGSIVGPRKTPKPWKCGNDPRYR